jgi:hypothetical protein
MNNDFKINAFDAYKKTKMPKGKQVIYELLGIKDDPDNAGRKLTPWYYVSPQDVIEHEGVFYEIGIVKSYNIDGSYVLDNLVSFSPENHARLALTPGVPSDEEIYRFFEWCNINESNPNRRTDIEPRFKKINAAANAKSDNDKKKALFDAQTLFYKMTEKEIVTVANLLAIPEDEIEVVKANLLVKLENQTELFLKVAKREPASNENVVLIKEALKKDILINNKAKNEITFGENGKTVAVYHGKVLKEVEILASIEKDHPDVLEAIKAQLA